LVTSFPKEPFMKWGLDFVGLHKPTWIYIQKDIYYYCHILCYQVGGSKSIEN
jgi:hypothetical protein